MKVILKGSSKEIADFVVAIQNRLNKDNVDGEKAAEKICNQLFNSFCSHS